MDKEQELEWLEAQKIVISKDLVAAAKQQLQFLETIDRNRCLYEGSVLHRAIYRYKTYWLPLVAKYNNSQDLEGPLVVPLDCEWVWHCHRLNPIQYKSDCEKFYGRILDNCNVLSTVRGTCKKQTEEIWSRLYPGEPFELDMSNCFPESIPEKILKDSEGIKYDLVSAVKRQSPFFYQVSRPSMQSDIFLEQALARYKGFLHLIKRNKERSIRRFCVPTYDVDLMWHSHQLHPVSYCKDMVEALGKVLEHDDVDSDRTKGQKLDVGFSETTKQWEETFGLRYWRAGAMYRGSAPRALIVTPYTSKYISKEVVPPNDYQEVIQIPKAKYVEVFLEIVGLRNIPAGHRGSFFVFFSKKQPDNFFNARRRLNIFSESGEKHVAAFQCEPTGELFFELMSHSGSNLLISRTAKIMGTTSMSLRDLLDPASGLSLDTWFELATVSGTHSKPISMHIAVSLTVPVTAPHVLHMIHSRPCSMSSCFFPLPGRVQHAKNWTCVVDEAGNDIINIQMRDSRKLEAINNCCSMKEVIGIVGSGGSYVLAESVGTKWSLMDSHWSFVLQRTSSEGDHLFELKGNRMVKLFSGRKLEYEPKCCERKASERDFLTAVEFSLEDPYGKAVAMINLKSGIVKVNEEWFVLPGIILAFVLSDIFRKAGYDSFLASGENIKGVTVLSEDVDGCNEGGGMEQKTGIVKEVQVDEAQKSSTVVPEKGGACGGCGSGCGGCGGGSGYAGTVNEVKVEAQKTNMAVPENGGACGGCGSGCGGCGGGSGYAGTVNEVQVEAQKTNTAVPENGGACGGCGSGCGGCGGGSGYLTKSGGCGGGSKNVSKNGGCGGCGGCGGDSSDKLAQK
ncbi:glycine-rich domain-containing protein 2 [Macadamia integrifolia]|uniref:glycine-rich domain-containing protein 2 n=1 Tax=Macadamia integrifolia TaxID=60698 RepID=UPI001C4EFE9F|nr:glycine-rich domain-containing protein 2 [Macadamia integrifolia]